MSGSFLDELLELRSKNLFRGLREISTPQGVEVRIAGERLINFSSNDYLGLANCEALKAAAIRGIHEFGVGSGASRLVCGSLGPHWDLERELAAFKQTEGAILFSTGYAAAVGTIGALCGREDVVILDKLAHASLIDGARLSGAVVRVFPHNHVGKLESHLEWARDHYPGARHLVVTESVFSMDGDRAPLREIVEVKERFDALLLVDEAHAVGILGSDGRGLADELGVARRIDFQMGTLSKALGTAGGYIAADRHAIDLLVNRARSLIYSTAPPPSISVAARRAIELLREPDGAARRERLWSNVKRAEEHLRLFFPDLPPAESAILPVILGDEELALEASRFLRTQGLLVPAIRYPTVARGKARLRVTFSADHSPEHIDKLTRAFAPLAEKIAALQAR